MINEKSSTYLFVGNVAKSGAGTIEALPNGSVAIVDAATGAVKTSQLNASDFVKVVMKTSKGKLLQSPVFQYGKISMKSMDESANKMTQQVSYLGATSDSSVTGIGTVTANKSYVVNVVLKNTIGVASTAPEVKFGVYKTLTTSQFDLVTGLKASLDRQLGSYRIIKVERVSDGNRTAFSAGSGDATGVMVTNNSNLVTYVKAGNAAATVSTPLTVGSYIKIKGILYKVAGATTSNFTLDTVYTGESETVAFSDSSTGVYNATVFGLKFTGIRQSFDPNIDSVEMSLIRFDILSEDLEVSEFKAVAPVFAPTDGIYISYLERYSQFLHKQSVVSSTPPTSYFTEADPTSSYKIYNITVEDQVEGSIAVGAKYTTKTNIIIATKTGLSEGIGTVLGIS